MAESQVIEQGNIVMLQTKVTPEIYQRLETIGKKFGFSIFKSLRFMSECLVRFSDDKHNLSDDLVRLIRMFENIPGWSKSICLADPEQELGIVEALYVIRAKGKEGYRLCWVERPMMDNDPYGWTATYNVQYIMERFIEVMNPSLYKHLRMLAVELGTESMWDTINRIASMMRENPDETELRRQFEDNDWEKGAKMHDRQQYKRTYTPSEATQQKLFEVETNQNMEE